jgi:diacylglycerol O-acyltransferase
VSLSGYLPPLFVSTALRLIRRLPQRVLTTVTTNVPGPRVPVYLLGRRMLALYPYVPIAERLRIGIALSSYADRLQFGITCDRDSVDDVDVLITGITDGLAELVKMAAHAGEGH